jgi:hypothetical protein
VADLAAGARKTATASVHAAKKLDDYAAERDRLAAAYLSRVRTSLLGPAPPASYRIPSVSGSGETPGAIVTGGT